MKLRLIIYSFLTMLCFAVGWFVYHDTQDASWRYRLIYPLEAKIAQNNINCTKALKHQDIKTKALLEKSIQIAREKGGALNTQIAFYSPKNQELISCAAAPWGETAQIQQRYRYASLSKMLTAQAVIRAMQEAQMPLSTPLTHFIEQAQTATQDERWKQITIEQLLSHQGGFDRLRSPDPMTRHDVRPWCPYDLDQIKKTSLDFVPGSGYGYSNLSYCLLGVVLERLTGKVMREALGDFWPLERFNIKFIDGDYLEDEVRYDFRHTGFYGEDYWRYHDFFALSSSAGLSGSAQSLAQMLVDERLSGNFTLSTQAIPTKCDPSKKRDCYGYALFPYKSNDNDILVWVHHGYLFGSSSVVIFDEFSGILVWLGAGDSPLGGSTPDIMFDELYNLLKIYYAG